MRTPFALLAALAVLHSVTVCSQTPPDIFDFSYQGVKYVGIKAASWEQMVANRLGSNALNRERAQSIGLQRSDVEAERIKGFMYRADIEEAKNEAAAAWGEVELCKDENVTLQRKNKRLRGWATAMKVQLGMIVIGGGIVAYKSIVP